MKSRFYDNGLQFECTGCGECCKYSDAVVYVTDEEISSIARYLTSPEEDFVLNYITAFRGKLVLKSKVDACIFLEDDRCIVYSARPKQCRTFPFWPDILKSRVRWSQVSESCEGMDQGKQYTAEEIREILNESKTVNGLDQTN
ncbi:MAG: YkgJ family cysteine cluster protein [Candidatus Marinimicrobia bacterium]|nr:YkgJ family cysteine cluster protein [Candidatus Neomarinimicrobiota bacterium]